MKSILTIITILSISLSSFSQRYIIRTKDNAYVCDSSGILITGTLQQLTTKIRNNISEDSADFSITNIIPAAGSLKIIYYPEAPDLQDIPSLPQMSLQRVQQAQSKIPIDFNTLKMVYDKRLGQVLLFNKNRIVSIQLTIIQ